MFLFDTHTHTYTHTHTNTHIHTHKHSPAGVFSNRLGLRKLFAEDGMALAECASLWRAAALSPGKGGF